MARVVQIVRQCVRGVPYLKKELARNLSLHTGKVFVAPMTYYVIFGGRCNLACPFCAIHKELEPMIPPAAMLRLLREAKALSGTGFNISLSGGEPTVYKPFYEALELANQLRVNFGFTTNGLTLTKPNVKRILAGNPFNINVSLESVDPAVNEILRPMKHGTKRTLEGIENVLAEKERTGARVSVIIKPTIMEQNYRGLPDLVRHFGRHSKVQVHFQPFAGPTEDPFWVRDLADLKRVFAELLELQREGYPVIGNAQQFQGFWNYLAQPPQPGSSQRRLDLGGKKRNCDIGLRSLFIYANGDVHFCDLLREPIGNIHRQSLTDMYHGAVAKRQRQRMVYCNIDCQQTCKRSTPIWVKARAFLRMG